MNIRNLIRESIREMFGVEGLATNIITSVKSKFPDINERALQQGIMTGISKLGGGGDLIDLVADAIIGKTPETFPDIHSRETLRYAVADGISNEAFKDKAFESDDPCWKNYKQIGTKKKGNKEVPNCVPIKEYTVDDEDAYNFLDEIKKCNKDLNESIIEAEYQGRKVTLNKPMRGDVKKFKVFVKNKKGNVVKVNFGAKGMRIKKDNPDRRRAFRARHNCDNPGPKWKARYWSCKKW